MVHRMEGSEIGQVFMFAYATLIVLSVEPLYSTPDGQSEDSLGLLLKEGRMWSKTRTKNVMTSQLAAAPHLCMRQVTSPACF